MDTPVNSTYILNFLGLEILGKDGRVGRSWAYLVPQIHVSNTLV